MSFTSLYEFYIREALVEIYDAKKVEEEYQKIIANIKNKKERINENNNT